jgi:NAD(P)-dependent dehydrogenase (short-subunit alcohol dehydrogenase family)
MLQVGDVVPMVKRSIRLFAGHDNGVSAVAGGTDGPPDKLARMGSRAGLVTGGSSGIGKALARALGQEGFGVTIGGRDEVKLGRAAAELRGDGITVEAVGADVANEAAIEALVEAHRRAFGRMDVLVNSAADGTTGLRIAELPTDVLDRNLDVNLRALFLTMRASMPMLSAAGAEHGKALVVNVSSMAAKGGVPGLSFYAAAKAGVIALTESAQAEARDAGIQFTIFTPGFTATPMAAGVQQAGVAAEEMVQPEDLGEGLRFLLRTSPSCLVREIEFVPRAQNEIIRRLAAQRERAATHVPR